MIKKNINILYIIRFNKFNNIINASKCYIGDIYNGITIINYIIYDTNNRIEI